MADDALTRKDAEMRKKTQQALLDISRGALVAEPIVREICKDAYHALKSLSLESVREETWEDAAQVCRYYLKHQNFEAEWDAVKGAFVESEFAQAVAITCENLEKIMLEKVALQSPARVAEKLGQDSIDANRYRWWRNAKVAEASHDYHFDDLLGKIENAADLAHEIDAAIDADMKRLPPPPERP